MENKLKVITSDNYDDLSDKEKDSVSDNGHGMEYANYVRVKHDGKTVFLMNDAIEPEDRTLNRDYSPLVDFINKAYELGYKDAINNENE